MAKKNEKRMKVRLRRAIRDEDGEGRQAGETIECSERFGGWLVFHKKADRVDEAEEPQEDGGEAEKSSKKKGK